jgi:hypothetical protein
MSVSRLRRRRRMAIVKMALAVALAVLVLTPRLDQGGRDIQQTAAANQSPTTLTATSSNLT